MGKFFIKYFATVNFSPFSTIGANLLSRTKKSLQKLWDDLCFVMKKHKLLPSIYTLLYELPFFFSYRCTNKLAKQCKYQALSTSQLESSCLYKCYCYIANAKTKRDWLIRGHVALDKCNVSPRETSKNCCPAANIKKTKWRRNSQV